VRVFALLTLIGVLASVAVAWERHGVEASYRTVEVVVDSESWRLLARREGVEEENLWRAVREAGATSVAVYEQTLRRLQDAGRVAVLDGPELRAQARSGRLPPAFVPLAHRPDVLRSVYAFPLEPEAGALVEQGLRNALGDHRVRPVLRDPPAYEVLGWRKDLEEIGLGFSPSEVRRWEQRGFRVVLRPRNVRTLDAERLRERIRAYGSAGRGLTFIFEGVEVLGYERLIPQAAAAFRELGGVYGRVEVLTAARRMRGEEALAARMRPRVVRVFSIGQDELDRMDPETARERFRRAVRERNLRIVYVRPFHSIPGGVDPVAYNLRYLRALVADLRAAGFRLGPAPPLPVPRLPRLLLYGAALGALSAGILLCGALTRNTLSPVAALLLVGGGWVVLLGLGQISEVWMRKLVALLGAVVFPPLAVHAGLPRGMPRAVSGGRVLLEAAVRLWLISLGSTAGGFLVAALLTDWPFLLASEVFFGVKIAAVLPLALVLLLGLADRNTPSEEPPWHRLWRALDRPLSLRTALALVLLGSAGLLLVLRTGNVSLPMLSLEERLRTALEETLVARPRTKEYLVGHPALLLGIAAYLVGAPRWGLPLVITGTIGQAGLVNSFAHLHTPVLYTVWRTANGLVLGTLVGMVAWTAGWILLRSLGLLPASGPAAVPRAAIREEIPS